MNYQQSYPGMQTGPLPPLKPAGPWTAEDQEDLEAEQAKEAQRDEEAAIDTAREIREGRYDD